MGINFDDLSQLPERYRKQVEKQVQIQTANRAARAAAGFVEEIKQRQEEKAAGRKTKYRNRPTARTMPNGETYTFDSKKEAARYDELCLLLKAGKIADLRLQPQFTLKESYITSNGDKSRSIVYKADFSYTDNNTDCIVVEDVKSDVTRKNKDYRMKKKLMQEIHGITIKEV